MKIPVINPNGKTIVVMNLEPLVTAKIVIKGKGNYTRKKDIMFRIIKDTTPTIDNIKIVEDRYSILNKDETKETVTDLVGNIQITSNNTVVNENDKLKTGDVLKVNDKEYQIAVLGDTNKDGKINISDLTRTYKIYNNLDKFKVFNRYDTNDPAALPLPAPTKMPFSLANSR